MHQNKMQHAKPAKVETYTGVIKVSGRGIGFFELPDGGEIHIEDTALNTALSGDTVEVALLSHQVAKSTNTRPRGSGMNFKAGKVIKILTRAKTEFVGTVEKSSEGKPHIIPGDRRVYIDIMLSDEEAKKASVGEKVLFELLWTDPTKNASAKILKVLGAAGDHETEMAAALYDSGFVSGFPEEVEHEAEKLAAKFDTFVAEELKHRRDFRDVPTFTIDPDDAKDFDDALSVRILSDNLYEIGVHIADVSFFVRPGTALDAEAKLRATSIYLVDRTIPMLPEALSNNICSLVEGIERLTYSAVFEIDGHGHVKKSWFGRTVIKSDKRFRYEEAQGILDAGHGPFINELTILNNVAKKMRAARIARGSVLFEKEEVKVVLDENKRPVGVRIKPTLDTNKLVEEWMLLANKSVAEFIGKANKGFVYRIHDIPDVEKIESLAIFIKALGYDLPHKKGVVTAKDINALFAQIKGTGEEALIQQAALRSMAKAIYSTKNIGHFGLGFEYYTHFTSPIRRYPDALVHRLLEHYLKGGKLEASELAEFQAASVYSSERENDAARAERSSIRFKQLEYMASQIGKEFDGIISGITEWGMYIEEATTKTEGMVPLRTLRDDYYEFNEKQYSLVGRRTKKKFRLGDPVRVKLTRVNIPERQLDFEIK